MGPRRAGPRLRKRLPRHLWWLRPNTFSIRYLEDGRSLLIEQDLQGDSHLVAIERASMRAWEPPNEAEPLSDEKKDAIIQNVQRALATRGYRLTLMDEYVNAGASGSRDIRRRRPNSMHNLRPTRHLHSSELVWFEFDPKEFADIARDHADDYPDLADRLSTIRRAAWKCGAYLAFQEPVAGGVDVTAVISEGGGEDYGVDLDKMETQSGLSSSRSSRASLDDPRGT
jgi:hypothetical protein